MQKRWFCTSDRWLALLCTAAMATGLLACAAPDAQRDAATAGAQQRMLDEWTKYVAAWNNHDPAGVAGAFSPDGYIDSPVTGGPARGDAIAQYAGGTFAGFPDFKLEIVNRQPMGDHGYADEWVMKGSWSGTFPGGPLKGVPPSGKPFVVHGSSILEYQNGKLISENVYFDRLSLLGQIGALPPGMK